MKSNQRSPVWPYLVVLTGLFFLSLAVPRGWHEAVGPSASDTQRLLARQRAAAREKPIFPQMVVVRPAEPNLGQPALAAPAEVTWHPTIRSADWGAIGRDVTASVYPNAAWAETVAAKIADLRVFDAIKNAIPTGDVTSGPSADPEEFVANDTTTIPEKVPDTFSVSDNRSATEANLTPNSNAVPDDNTKEIAPVEPQTLPADQTEIANDTPSNPQPETQPTEAVGSSYWPVPTALMAQLNRLSADPDCKNWVDNVKALCLEVCRTSPTDLQRAAPLIRQLQSLAEVGDTLAGTLKNNRGEELRRVRYALQRRLAVWSAVFNSDRHGEVFADVTASEQQRLRLTNAVTAAQTWVRAAQYGDEWKNYLMLDDLQSIIDAKEQVPSDESRQIARQVLSRISPHTANEAQRKVLSDPVLHELAEQLRFWAVEPVDVRAVIAGVEQYEITGLPSDARRVMASQRQLTWSAAEEDHQLADSLDSHYRNANVRIALTAELLNRLVPEQPARNGVVNDTIMGAVVKGFSETKAQLSVKFVPDPARLHLYLQAAGVVDSQTQATAGPATFSNRGEATYQVRKEVILDKQGITATAATGEAKSDSKLTGVHTDFDRVPVIGGIARNRATTQHERKRDEADREVDQKVATNAEQQLNAAVDRRLQEAEQLVRQELLAPLTKLELQAEPITLETNAMRATMRLRLAGLNQLGGHTARPQAPSDSVASLQLHESALNNMLDQLQLAGRSFTLPELIHHLGQRISWPAVPQQTDSPPDVTIAFAPTDPVRIRCQDGVVHVTLAVAELRQGQKRWHDFVVNATYAPMVDQLHLRLVRQGAIEIGGDTYKGQPEVVLRGIFSKVLVRERVVELVPNMIAEHPRLADLCITQCVIEDGWVGVAIGPDRALVHSSVATRPTTEDRR